MASTVVKLIGEEERRFETGLEAEEKKYSQLSSVSWVNSKWIAFALISLLVISLVPALVPYNDGSLPLMIWLIVGCVVLAYPYIHYRVNGGMVKRIPPRYIYDKPSFSKTNI